MTLKEATRRFLDEVSNIPLGLIADSMENDPSSWQEVTAPSKGDKVYVYSAGDEGTVVGYDEDSETFTVELDDAEDGEPPMETTLSDLECIFDGALPMWGTVFAFKNSLDDDWLSEDDGIIKMSACGFRIFYHEEYGFFFGIDGAGYDFYEAHWEPLYLARGLHWHTDPQKEGA